MSLIKIFFKNFKDGMSKFGENITLLVNSCLLLIVYVIGIGATSIVAKLCNKQFLKNKISTKRTTYWSELNSKTKSIESYYKLF